ncbi:MAG: UDP-N-acetylglucosamine 1-carboxyvinyltransferase [Thermodesulfobacteriota bacterium]
MDKLVIEGGVPLKGRIALSGSKNAALPLLLASILVPEEVRFSNVPPLRDIATTIRLLELLGCAVDQDATTVAVTAGKELHPQAPYELVRTMRASVLCLGPLLARLGQAEVSLPGGCAIGARPVDLHLRALEQMGAEFTLEGGDIKGHCRKLRGARIAFDFPTVGGTENALMAAVLAEGETVLENAAREPEISDLAHFLNACGARISGQGTSVIRIQGVASLHRCQYAIMPDRIETGTYLAAAAITDGELLLENGNIEHIEAVVSKFEEMGVAIEQRSDGLLVSRARELEGVYVTTQPYPGFPTDMQAQIMAVMALSHGSGLIKETIFENRFMHVGELIRLGAEIKLSGQNAMVSGVPALHGAPVMASDLRASASLVLAGLAAQGGTEVRRIYHLDRGYVRMEEKLGQVGARIKRERE